MFTSGLSRTFAPFAVALLLGVLAGPPIARGDQGDCSQPVSTGTDPVATDCLFILRVVVALELCIPLPCVCDPTGDGSTTATDALTCLKKVVAEPITLMCPCGTTTSSTTTSSTTTTSTTTTSSTTTVPNTADCTDNGSCFDDDCVCSDCDDDLFCSDPTKCVDNGDCNEFAEGCVCADCATHPECLDN